MVFPADAQYHKELELNALPLIACPKYSSMTILPSFKTINALVFEESK